MKNKLILSLLCATAIGGSGFIGEGFAAVKLNKSKNFSESRDTIDSNFDALDAKITALQVRVKALEAPAAATASAPTLKKAAAVGSSGYFASGTSRNLFSDEDRKIPVAATRGTNAGGKEYWTLDDGTILRGDGKEMKPTKIDGINYYEGKDGKFYKADGIDSGIKKAGTNVIGRKGDKWNGSAWEAVAPTPPPPPPVTYDALGGSIYFKNSSQPTDTKLYTDSSGTKVAVANAKFIDAAGTTPNYWLLDNGNGDLVRTDGTVMERVDLGSGKVAYRGKGGTLSNADGTRYTQKLAGSFKKEHFADSKGRVYKDAKAAELDTRFSRTVGTDDAFDTFAFEKEDAVKGKKKAIAADGSQVFTLGDKATKGLKKSADGKVTNSAGLEVTKGTDNTYEIPNLGLGGSSGAATDLEKAKAKAEADKIGVIKSIRAAHINTPVEGWAEVNSRAGTLTTDQIAEFAVKSGVSLD